MEEQINKILQDFNIAINKIRKFSDFEKIRVEYLGRKGIINSLILKLKEVPQEKKSIFGKLINEVKDKIEKEIRNKSLEIEKIEIKDGEDKFDVTLPGRCIKIGKIHTISQVLNEIKKVFISMGFEVEEGPEIETDYYNFEGLNIGLDHPARDEWDSFYISDKILLRTHTSPVQLRVMEKRKPPLKVIAPGRCFRRDAIDRTHSHTFHQVEGFMVDRGITFGDLKGVLTVFARSIFGEDVKMRFRPDYFPFTEPSADGAISCIICKGKGCPVCSNTGYLEIFGCGSIHPKVLQNVGYNSEDWTGFAFGMGCERIAMLKYGIDDIRLFLENDIRFLEQF